MLEVLTICAQKCQRDSLTPHTVSSCKTKARKKVIRVSVILSSSPSPHVMGDPHVPSDLPTDAHPPLFSLIPTSSSPHNPQIPPATSPTKTKSFASLFQKATRPPDIDRSLPLIPLAIHHGEPMSKIPQDLVIQFSPPFSLP